MVRLYSLKVVLLLLLSSLSGKALAQLYSYTAGTSGNAFPLQTTSSNLCQFIYQPSNFTGIIAGNVTKIYVMANSATTGGTFSNLTVKMGATTLSAFSTGSFVTGLTTVYSSASATCPAIAAGGWYEILLQTPFFYNGTSNFIVEISQTAYTGGGVQIRYNSAVSNGRLYGSVTGTTGTAGAGLLNLGLDIVPAGPCTSPPTAGTTGVSATNLCAGKPLTLNLTGNSYGTGQTYQWQTSPTATGTYTNLGTAQINTPFYSTTATSSLYYRCAVTCGTSTVYSNPVLVTVPSLFPAGTYTINSAVATGGTNFQTFNDAVNAVKCGTTGPVIFNVATGTGPYNEQVYIPEVLTTSATNTITFNGNGATLSYTGTSAAPHTLGLDGADYFRFNNLTINGTDATYALVAHLWNGANNNIFTNCTFNAPANGSSSYQVPFSISGAVSSGTTTGLGGDSNLITGCTMNSGYYNTCIVGNTTTLATNNRVVNCSLKDFYAYGSYNYYASGTEITNNIIERPNATSPSTYYGIYVTTGCLGIKIDKNKLRAPFGGNTASSSSLYGIYIVASAALGSEHIVTNNLMYNLMSAGSLYCMYLSSSNYVNAYHNTIAVDDISNTSTGTVYGVYSTGTSGVDIRNNIVYINRGGAGTKYCLYYSGAKTSNKNDLYITFTSGTNAIGYFSSAYTTLATWQTANSNAFDQQSASINPVFFSPSTGNYRPTILAGLNNLGAPVGVLTDIAANTRSTTTPDVGAYEFGEIPPTCVMVPPVSPANNSANACAGTTTLRWNSVIGATSYDVYLNAGTAAPTTIVSANQTDTFFNASTVAGPYAWKIIPKNIYGTATGCDIWYFTTITGITPTATITATPGTTACVDVPVTFSATHTNGGTNPTWQWKLNGVNVGTNSPNYTNSTLATGDSVRVVMTSNSNLCLATSTVSSNKLTMTINPAPPAVITAGGPTAFCRNGSVTLQGGPSGQPAYQWVQNGQPIAGATSLNYTALYSGVYRLRVTGTNSCTKQSDSIVVTVFQLPYPLVNRLGNVLSTAPNYMSYQWYFNGQVIPGATTNTLTVTRDGRYKVKVTDTTACGGTSVDVPVNSLSVGNISAGDVAIYPNPTTGMVTISCMQQINAEVKSMDGKTVLSATNTNAIDITRLANGLYILYVSDTKGNVVKVEKLVKRAE